MRTVPVLEFCDLLVALLLLHLDVIHHLLSEAATGLLLLPPHGLQLLGQLVRLPLPVN